MAIQQIRPSSHDHRSRKVLGVVASTMGLVALVVVLELTNTTHFLHAAPAVSGKIPVVATGTTSTTNPKNNATSPNQVDTSTGPTTPQPVVKSSGAAQNQVANQSPSTLQAPFGSFVSNHSPNLSGSPTPSQEQSICNTTPGAVCAMTFTNDAGVVKTLPAQTADSNGTASWAWDVKTAGFTTGNWTIVVTATLDGQSKSSNDQLPLKIQP